MDLISANRVKDSQVIVSTISLELNLMVFDLTDYDIILCMDWLAKNHASIDCYKKEVVFTSPSKTRFKFKGMCVGTMLKLVSMMKVRKLV